MKKVWFGLMGAILVIGLGTSAFAAVENPGEGTMNFGQMLPFMQKMHPDKTTQELKDMYELHHGTGGAAPSANFEQCDMDMTNMISGMKDE